MIKPSPAKQKALDGMKLKMAAYESNRIRLNELSRSAVQCVTSAAEQLTFELKIMELHELNLLTSVQAHAEYRAIMMSENSLWPEEEEKEEERSGAEQIQLEL